MTDRFYVKHRRLTSVWDIIDSTTHHEPHYPTATCSSKAEADDRAAMLNKAAEREVLNTANMLDVLADAFAAPGASVKHERTCRECHSLYLSDTDRSGSKWLDCCPECLSVST